MGETPFADDPRWKVPPSDRALRVVEYVTRMVERHSERYGPFDGTSTPEPELERRKRAHWWERGPVFSTTDRGRKITVLAPGERPGRLTAGLAALFATAAAAWTALAYLGLAWLPGVLTSQPGLGERPTTWWWIVLFVLSLKAVGLSSWGLHALVRRRFGQRSFAKSVVATAGTFGFTAGAALHVAGYAATLADGERFRGERVPDLLVLIAVLALLLLAVRLLWLVFALLRVKSRQRLIHRLRAKGRRFDGEVESTDFHRKWSDERPQFDVMIRYEADGVGRAFRAAMITSFDRVPLPGFPVRIMVDERSATLVEPDVERSGYEFDSDWAHYAKPSNYN
ncbi:hypothetical protein [Glycomyces sp. NRRL B-16210]|uniref:hypothetical protein n=1 Tax=Glycomyces sp. NRRL B-16210 TaxID=1463821 RepID=UPI0004BE557D|nr:hypothetical protein [Glycomyces sp. NRRL B-16210]